MIRIFFILVLSLFSGVTLAGKTHPPIRQADRVPVFTNPITFTFDSPFESPFSSVNYALSLNALRNGLGSRPTPQSPIQLNVASNIDNVFTRVNIVNHHGFNPTNPFQVLMRNSDLYIMGFIISAPNNMGQQQEWFFRFNDASMGRLMNGDRNDRIDINIPEIPTTRTRFLPFSSTYGSMVGAVTNVIISRNNVFGGLRTLANLNPNNADDLSKINSHAINLLPRLAVAISEATRFGPIQTAVANSLYNQNDQNARYTPSTRDAGLVNGYRPLSALSIQLREYPNDSSQRRLDDGTMISRSNMATYLSVTLLCINSRSGPRVLNSGGSVTRTMQGCNMDDYYTLKAANNSWLSWFERKGSKILSIFADIWGTNTIG